MMRGDIWTASGGKDHAGNPRRIVVIQSDRFADLESVTVCPFTTDPLDLPLFRLAIEPTSDNGLRLPSRIMVDMITTMPKSKFDARIGKLNDADRARLTRAVAVFLGVAN